MTDSNDITTIPAARNNNLVAESDLTAALQALADRFEVQIGNIVAASTRPEYCDADSYEEAILMKQKHLQLQQLQLLLKDCQNSLSEHIQNIVQPVSDEAFHTYVYSQQQQQQQQQQTDKNNEENADENSSNNNNNKSKQVSTKQPPVQEQPLWDEDDLMDPMATERVQELRRQVRTEAAKVLLQQQAVTAKAVTVAERQVQLLVRINKNKNKKSASASGAGAGSLTEVPPESVAKIQEMQTCLSAMMTALQQTEQDLPDKLTSLQQTVSTIQASFEKPGLSQTEQAIRAREVPSSSSGAGGSFSTDAVSMEPAARLANFLRGD